jgi:tRNA pseudouridine38-40 synthase
MRNIRITIQYDGTNYSGWQFQKNGRSIQETIQKALKGITGEKACVIGSVRTDAGVHAEAQVANFRTRSVIPLKNLMMALNSALPSDIVVTRIESVPRKFNAQHDARYKVYRYTVMNADYIYPFIRRYAARCFFKLDVTRMRKAAKILVGRHDFDGFRKRDGDALPDSVRTITYIRIAKNGKLVYIYVKADAFLYNMVRNIVGTLIEVGRGKFNLERVHSILNKKDRRLCGPTAPAEGLCLMKVKYQRR